MPTTSIFNGNAPVEIGELTTGQILWYQIKDSTGVIAFLDARTLETGITSFTDTIGNLWTLNNNATVIDYITKIIVVSSALSRTSNIIDYDNAGTDKPVTALTLVGAGEGNDMLLEEVSSLGNIPLIESKLIAKDETESENLISIGERYLATLSNVNKKYKLNLDPNLSPRIDDLKTGDFIRVVINDNFIQEDDLFYVGLKRVTLSEQQDEIITLEVTE